MRDDWNEENETILSCLITYIDFHDSEIRIFGRNTEFESVLLRIHGYFAYLYFELPQEFEGREEEAKRQAKTDIERKYANSVHNITIEDGIPFYRFRQACRFVRIFVTRPAFIQKVKFMLLQGSVLNTFLQPYETHISPIMHFMCDYNLSGMQEIRVRNATLLERGPTPTDIPENMNADFSVDIPLKISTSCDIEAFGSVEQILVSTMADDVQVPSLQYWVSDANLVLGKSRVFDPTTMKTLLRPNVENFSLDEKVQHTNKHLLHSWVDAKRGLEDEEKSLLETTVENKFNERGESVTHSQEIEELVKDWKQLQSQIASFSQEKEKEAIVLEDKYNLASSESEGEGDGADTWDNFNVETDQSTVKQNARNIPLQDFVFPRFIRPAQNPPRFIENPDKQDIGSNSSVKSNAAPKKKMRIKNIDKISDVLPLKGISVEIFASSRTHKMPCPEKNPVCMIVVFISYDMSASFSEDSGKRVVLVTETSNMDGERKLFLDFVHLIEEEDPDVILGYEIQQASLGYLIRRAPYVGLNNFSRNISRAAYGVQDARNCRDEWGDRNHSGFWIVGRVVLNIWRILRHQCKLRNYGLQNVAKEVLNRRVSCYRYKIQNIWYKNQRTRRKVVEYLYRRCALCFEIMDKLEIVIRTAQMARFICTDFFSVLTRGSQFRVEGVMTRIAKRKKYRLPSPTKKQVKNQKALDEISLTLEPMSRYYTDPVGVFDFRSLYPSVMITFNLCFSTIVGRISPGKRDPPFSKRLGPFVFNDFDKEKVKQLLIDDELYFAPNNTVFVKKSTRKGLVPIMLEEILSARVLIKRAMKKLMEVSASENVKENSRAAYLYRVFDARQYALKMIANVTYGYASASYSGRMPCAEIADTIVCIGRRSLERCITHLNTSEDVKVVYGDTDSLFLQFINASMKSAFERSKHLANKLTVLFPYPMELQFEKIYYRSFLVAKKRYCGAIFESYEEFVTTAAAGISQKKLVLDTKGLEIVRRDTCSIVGYVMQALVLRLFATDDYSSVQVLFNKLLLDILYSRFSVTDFIIASRVRIHYDYNSKKVMSGYRSKVPPPSAVVALKKMKLDSNNYPLYKQRVPYIVARGLKSVRLVDKVCSPTSKVDLNYEYYICHKVLPALDRLFALSGVDVFRWWNLLEGKPKILSRAITLKRRRNTLRRYLESNQCEICRRRTNERLCVHCKGVPECQLALVIKDVQRRNDYIKHWYVCHSVCDQGKGGFCSNVFCEFYYKRNEVSD